MKFKHSLLFFVFVCTAFLTSCDDDELIEDITDTNTQVALIDDTNLVAIKHVLEDIDVEYTAYVYHTSIGQGTEVADDNDLVWVKYTLTNSENEIFEEVPFFDEPGFDLSNSIVGWQIAIPKLLPAESVDETSDPTTPREFINPGEAFLIIPSGLAYQNIGNGVIDANQTLFYKVALGHVEKIENEEE